MKFRNYLDTIADIGIYPLLSLLMFFAFFLGLLWYVFSLSRKETKEMSNLPLEDGTIRKTVLTVFLGLISFSGFAQEKSEPYSAGDKELLISLLIIGSVVVVVILLVILWQVVSIARRVAERQSPERKGDVIFSAEWWRKFRGASVRVGDEDKILIKEHEYDGIQELDNRMPPWLSFLFQGTIAFAVVYMLIYHGFKVADLPEAELEKSLKIAAIQKAAYLEKEGAKIDENSVTASTAPQDLEAGQTIYTTNCAACHGQSGEGTVGPNLTDEYWLHGGSIHDIFKVIKYGVPEKGMISWERQLKPQEIQQVASYIVSIKGSNPANPKEPQGELWKEEGGPVAVSEN